MHMHLASLLPQILALFLFLISNKAILLKKRKAPLRTQAVYNRTLTNSEPKNSKNDMTNPGVDHLS